MIDHDIGAIEPALVEGPIGAALDALSTFALVPGGYTANYSAAFPPDASGGQGGVGPGQDPGGDVGDFWQALQGVAQSGVEAFRQYQIGRTTRAGRMTPELANVRTGSPHGRIRQKPSRAARTARR